MSEKRYYWLKLKEDFFSSKRIKKLRKLAGGDTYTIIYLKMQLLSLKHGGEIHFSGLENSFAEELALDLDESVENVQVTLQYLQSCGLIETSDNISFLLPYAVENTSSEGSSAKRWRDWNARQKALVSNKSLTDCKQITNGDIDIEKEIEIEKDIEIDNPPISPLGGKEPKPKNPFSGDLGAAVDEWLAYKNEKKQPYKPMGLKQLFSKIKSCAEQYGEEEMAAVIRDSMASNYQGIVYDKLNKPDNQGSNGRQKAKKPGEYKGADFWD